MTKSVLAFFLVLSVFLLAACGDSHVQSDDTQQPYASVSDRAAQLSDGNIPVQATSTAASESDEVATGFADADAVAADAKPTYESYLVKMQDFSDDDLDAICEKYSATGVQCAVIEDGFVTGSYVYGFADLENDRPVTANTKYRIASLSKFVTDMVFMKLAEEGVVDADTDIGTYYDFSVRNPNYPDVVITPRMLMTHTASVIDGDAFQEDLGCYSRIDIESVLTDNSVYSAAEPGTNYIYSNFSNALVGSVCELASGQCFEDLAQSLLLEPMKIDAGYMASSIDSTTDIGLLYGGTSTLESQLLAQFNAKLGQTVHLVQGNFTVSACDFAQLLCLLFNEGRYADGTQILKEETVAELLKVQFDAGDYGVGLGSIIYDESVFDRTIYAHTGSAYGMYACYAFDPVAKDGVVVLSSGAYPSVDKTTEIYNICLDIIRHFMDE